MRVYATALQMSCALVLLQGLSQRPAGPQTPQSLPAAGTSLCPRRTPELSRTMKDSSTFPPNRLAPKTAECLTAERTGPGREASA